MEDLEWAWSHMPKWARIAAVTIAGYVVMRALHVL